MEEQTQVQAQLKVQLEEIQKQILDNATDVDKMLEDMKAFAELTLFIVSFEFTQKVMNDPDFMKQLYEEIAKDKK